MALFRATISLVGQGTYLYINLFTDKQVFRKWFEIVGNIRKC